MTLQHFEHFPDPPPVAWRESLLLAFAEVPLDPNPSITSLEVQRLRHKGREACNVVIHRPDKTIEVYHDQTLGLRPGWTALDPAFAHMEVSVESSTDLSTAVCRIDPTDNHIEASFTDATGADLSFRLHFPAAKESGPIFIPSPPCANPTQMRFLTLNRFRLVDSRTAYLQITRDGQELAPKIFAPMFPKHRLAARAGAELLCASLCSPNIQTETPPQTLRDDPAIPAGITIRNHASHLTLQLDAPDQQAAAKQAGSARVLSRLGKVASAKWECNTTPASTFRLFDIEQDWRPGGFAPTKHALRAARRYRRRNESWNYTHTAGSEAPTASWSS